MGAKSFWVLLMVAWMMEGNSGGYAFPARNYKTQLHRLEAPSGPIKDGFRLSAQVQNAVDHSGDPIILNLTLTNVSNQTRVVVISRSDYDYKVDVTNERGQKAPLTKLGEELLTMPRSYDRRILHDMKPHEELKERLRVSDVFDLTKPGTYSITAKRSVRAQGPVSLPPIDVVSNTIKVRVI